MDATQKEPIHLRHSPELGELAAALALAQGEFTQAKKDGWNPFFKAKYASLASVYESCRAQLIAHGFAVVQHPTEAEGQWMDATDAKTGLVASTWSGWLSTETILIHKSGQWIGGTFRLPVTTHSAQGYGAVLTLARRYSFCALIGIVADDESHTTAPAKQQPAKQQQTPPPTGDLAQSHKTRPQQSNAVETILTRNPEIPGGTFKGRGLASLSLAELETAAKEAGTDGWQVALKQAIALRLAERPI